MLSATDALLITCPPLATTKQTSILSQSDKLKRNWSSYQTDLDTKRLIRLYYLSFSASRVPCNALCAIDFYFSLLSFSSWRSLSPSLHLHHPLPSSEMSCRSDGCWAGSIRESNLGRLMHASTHTDTSQILTNPHTHTLPLLHSGLPASSLIDLHLLYQMDSSLFLSSSTSFLSV